MFQCLIHILIVWNTEGVGSFSLPIPKLLDSRQVSHHQEQFWEDLKERFAQLHPNTAYAILFHPSSAHGMVTLGNSILVDRNSDLSQIRTHIETILARHEEDYEEDFIFTCQVKVKEIGPQVKERKPSTSVPRTSPPPIQPAPIEAGPQINTISSSPQTLKTLQSMNTSISSMASEIHQIYLAERRQERRSQGYERLAESLAMGIEKLLNLPSSSAIGSSPVTPTPVAPSSDPFATSSPRQDVILEQLSQGFNSLTSTVTTLTQGFNNLSSTVNQLTQGFATLSSTVESQGQQISDLTTLVRTLATLTPSVVPNDPDEGNNGDSTPPVSTPPTTPPSDPNGSPISSHSSVQTSPSLHIASPISLQSSHEQKAYINPMKISGKKFLVDSIVTADLESLIRKDNSQLC